MAQSSRRPQRHHQHLDAPRQRIRPLTLTAGLGDGLMNSCTSVFTLI